MTIVIRVITTIIIVTIMIIRHDKDDDDYDIFCENTNKIDLENNDDNDYV